MTDHPLTDEKLFKQFWDYTCGPTPMGNVLYTPDGMRAAYDLAVNKAVDEFSYALYVLSQNYGDILDKQDRVDLVREFREAMYTNITTQEDN